MTDPWADVRERLLTGRWFDHELTDLEIEHVKSMEADIERLLADADALLAVVRAAQNVNHKPLLGRRMFRCSHCEKDTPLLVDRFLIEFEKVEAFIDALPEHLKWD